MGRETLGGLMMAAGILIATLSGMCALGVLATGGHGIVPVVISVAVGVCVALLGWSLNQR
jgi:hypothetical protein